ncbi:Chitinase B precursor [Posidoniimonas corsicana]|uniref:chitinase n=1 Tax=Posidoniimonas corsicana TaxID=1938618 RepID=A0A5C5VEA9_9BACT|nr:glycoside hydrolase family 18 protein [Posidoniimonas corsicana]TWT36948.1 Chitinase B precursor [Posidoniimonas corsicana]
MVARRLAPLMILATALACATPATAQRTPRVFLGYYAAIGDLPIEQIPWRQLTHVSHAFLAVDSDGELVENDLVPSKRLTEAAHQNRVRVLLSLGGGKTAEGLTKIAQSPERLEAYAKSVTAAAIDNGYDGVDIDWESPHNQQTMEGFARLVKLLRGELDAAARRSRRRTPYLLTAAVPPSNHLGKWFDTGAIASRIDWFNVMAYDMSGPWERTAGHHAPLFPSPKDPERSWRSVQSAMEYWHKDRGVPKGKLIVGLPMYGRALPVSKPLEPLDPAKRQQHGALDFRKVRELVGQGWPAMWDHDSHAPWARPPAQRKSPLLICFDDRNSIDEKSKWAQQQGYRGLSFWAIHQDLMPDGAHWLLQSAYRAWPPAN